MEEFLLKARSILAALPQFSGAEVFSSSLLAGDASARSYVRLNLRNSRFFSVILMILAKTPGPVAGGEAALSQSDSFVVLNSFLRRNGLPVPEIFFDGRREGFLLVEDVDDVPLWRIALQEMNPAQAKLAAEVFKRDPSAASFKRAIDYLVVLQKTAADAGCPAFGRYLSRDEYRLEAQRFVDLCLIPRGFGSSRLELVGQMLDQLCVSLDAHPRALCYRDYMAWNIMLDPAGRLRLLDYQDLLLASRAYDVAALLNDRDIDVALGCGLWNELVEYAARNLSGGEGFKRLFLECALQRDLRLAGQFWNLSQSRGKPQYEKWVPGCLRRIGRSLAGLGRWPQVLQELSAFSPEIKGGAKEPWLTCGGADCG